MSGPGPGDAGAAVPPVDDALGLRKDKSKGGEERGDKSLLEMWIPGGSRLPFQLRIVAVGILAFSTGGVRYR